MGRADEFACKDKYPGAMHYQYPELEIFRAALKCDERGPFGRLCASPVLGVEVLPTTGHSLSA